MSDDALGPISYLVAEFPGNKMTGRGFQILLDLVDRGLIRILDLVFVTKAADGSVALLDVEDLDHDGTLDFTIFTGVSSGLVSPSDLPDLDGVLAQGSSAGVLLFENRWATEFVGALRESGAQLVAAGYIPQDVLVQTLDEIGG
jgi:hypothetical protein